jgi:hypothetical protein
MCCTTMPTGSSATPGYWIWSDIWLPRSANEYFRAIQAIGADDSGVRWIPLRRAIWPLVGANCRPFWNHCWVVHWSLVWSGISAAIRRCSTTCALRSTRTLDGLIRSGISKTRSPASRDASTGHKLFKLNSFSFQSRRWAHIKRSAEIPDAISPRHTL